MIAGDDPHVSERLTLQTRLLDAVKQVPYIYTSVCHLKAWSYG